MGISKNRRPARTEGDMMGRLRRMLTGTLVVLGTTMVAGAATASTAQAQQGETPAAGSELGAVLERVRGAFDAVSAARIEELAASAAEAGVPRTILLDKALEGAAKGVPADRVIPALSTYSERLVQARGILGEQVGASALVAGADALQKGVSTDHLRSIARSGGDQEISIVVLGDLVDAGIPADRAVEVVGAALEEGRTGQEMLAVPSEVRGMLRQGMPPAEVATEIQRRIRAGEQPPGAAGNPPGQRGAEGRGDGPPGEGPPGGGSGGGGQGSGGPGAGGPPGAGAGSGGPPAGAGGSG